MVFAEEVRPFKKQQLKTFDRKYKIAFLNPSVEEAFRKLLDHTCKVCADVPEYRTFNALKDHMRREHEQFYCDLCVENLKVSKPNFLFASALQILQSTPILLRSSRRRGALIHDKNLLNIEEKVMQTTDLTEAILCASSVINVLWTVMNCLDI